MKCKCKDCGASHPDKNADLPWFICSTCVMNRVAKIEGTSKGIDNATEAT
jgi:hypothetical protein